MLGKWRVLFRRNRSNPAVIDSRAPHLLSSTKQAESVGRPCWTAPCVGENKSVPVSRADSEYWYRAFIENQSGSGMHELS